MNSFQEWWQSLVYRERMVVCLLGLIIVALIFQILIWQPLHQARENTHNSNDKQAALLMWMQKQSTLVKTLTVTKPLNKASSKSISQRVNLTAKKQKIAISRFQASDEKSIQVWLVGADFSTLLIWLDLMHKKHGITVDSIAVTETNKSGLVDVRASLSSD